MDHRGAVKVCISLFFPPLPTSSWRREGNALCFPKDVQFSSLHPFFSESSCRILKPSNRGFRRPLAAVMAPCRILLAMSSGDSAKVGEENQENLQREDIPETLAKRLQFSFMWSINQAPCSVITVKRSKARRDPLTKSGKHWDIIAPFIRGGSVTHSARGKIKHCFVFYGNYT